MRYAAAVATSLLDRAVSHYGLTQHQARVVVAYCESGNLAAACRRVQYDYREAKRALKDNPGFQAAVAEYVQGLYLADRVKARKVIVRLMEKADSERVRLDAAKWLDERAAGKAAEVHIHEHRFSMDRAAIHAEIARLAQELRMDEEIEVRVLDEGPPVLPEEAEARGEVGRREALPEPETDTLEGGPPAVPPPAIPRGEPHAAE